MALVTTILIKMFLGLSLAHGKSQPILDESMIKILSKGKSVVEKHEKDSTKLWWISKVQKDVAVLLVSVALEKPIIISYNDTKKQKAFAQYLENARRNSRKKDLQVIPQDLQRAVFNNQVVLTQSVQYKIPERKNINSFQNYVYSGPRAYGVFFYSRMLSTSELKNLSDKLFIQSVSTAASPALKLEPIHKLITSLLVPNAWADEMGRGSSGDGDGDGDGGGDGGGVGADSGAEEFEDDDPRSRVPSWYKSVCNSDDNGVIPAEGVVIGGENATKCSREACNQVVSAARKKGCSFARCHAPEIRKLKLSQEKNPYGVNWSYKIKPVEHDCEPPQYKVSTWRWIECMLPAAFVSEHWTCPSSSNETEARNKKIDYLPISYASNSFKMVFGD